MFDNTIENAKDRIFNRVALVVWNPDAAEDDRSYVVLRVKPDEVPARIEGPQDTYLTETRKIMPTFTMFASGSRQGRDRNYSITLGTGERKPITFPALAA